MAKTIREKYESGILVSREIEVSGGNLYKSARLCIQIIIAISLTVIAVLQVRDSLLYGGMVDSGLTESACRPPEFHS